MRGKNDTQNQSYDKKHQLAYLLFVDNGLDQKVIAKSIGVNEMTISRWRKKDKKNGKDWEDDRAELRQGFDKERRRIKKHINTILDSIEIRKAPRNIANASESDSINKLASAAEKLLTQLSLSDKMNTGKEFFAFTQKKYGHQKALEILELWNEYVMQA